MDSDPIIKYFPFVALLTPFVLFFNQIRAFANKLFSLIVVRVDLSDDVKTAFNYYIQIHGKKWPLGSSRYNSILDYSKVDKKRVAVGYEEIDRSPQLLKIGKSFLLTKVQKTDNGGMEYDRCLTFYYIRGTFKHEPVLIEALDFLNARQESNRFKVIIRTGEGKKTIVGKENGGRGGYDRQPHYLDSHDVYKSNRILKYDRKDLGSVLYKEDVSRGYVFCAAAKKLINECQKWFESENWYRKHGILWRRGILINGIQGSGKTSLVRKICQILDIPLYCFDLASMSNKEFVDNWLECQSESPCAVLFDDIDKVFNGKENIVSESGGGLTFDAFLSALSGAQPSEGILVFCTTNDLSKIDETLAQKENSTSSRPGRIDTIVEINEMAEEDRRILAKELLGDYDLDIEKIVQNGSGMTAAQFNNMCSNLSLNKYWESKQNY
jgi:hypothetical protein